MFFLTPAHTKQGRQFAKDARKLLAYKCDLVDAETVALAKGRIEELEATLRTGSRAEVEERMQRVDEACGKLAKPHPEAAWRENVEVFLVAIVIALAVRTYFLQPFTIPTGSMQPTLNGIIGYPTVEPPPNLLVRIAHFAMFGRTYVDTVAKEDEDVAESGIEEVKRALFFTYTRLESSKGNVYLVHAPPEPIKQAFIVPHGDVRLGEDRRPVWHYKAGEPICRGYVNTGDHVFVDKVSYNLRPPQRSEVFVFTTEGIPGAMINSPTSQFYIKRLAGLPGDNLMIKPPQLFINGMLATAAPFQRVMRGTYEAPVEGYHGYSNGPDPRTSNSIFPLLNNPAASFSTNQGEYFALGDNSYHSADSRAWGVVPERNIMGRAVFVYWPFTSHWGLIR